MKEWIETCYTKCFGCGHIEPVNEDGFCEGCWEICELSRCDHVEETEGGSEIEGEWTSMDWPEPKGDPWWKNHTFELNEKDWKTPEGIQTESQSSGHPHRDPLDNQDSGQGGDGDP